MTVLFVALLTSFQRSAPHPHCHSERSAQHEVKNLIVCSQRNTMSFRTERIARSEESHRLSLSSSLRSLTSFEMTVLFVALLTSFQRSAPHPHCHSERSAQHEVKNLIVCSQRNTMSFRTARIARSEESHRLSLFSLLRSLTSFEMTLLFVVLSSTQTRKAAQYAEILHFASLVQNDPYALCPFKVTGLLGASSSPCHPVTLSPCHADPTPSSTSLPPSVTLSRYTSAGGSASTTCSANVSSRR